MTRAFRDDPVDPELVDGLLDLARRVPTAGNTQGLDFVVLHGPAETARYWDVTLPPQRRARFRWQRLLAAPVLVIVYADAAAYLERYRRPDKARTGLGTDPDGWPVPYWTVDAAFAAMVLQLAAVDAGLGVLFFGQFDRAEAVAAELGVPPDRQAIGTVALGWPDRESDEPGRSARLPRRPLDEVVHRNRW
jgi:nitroreductase